MPSGVDIGSYVSQGVQTGADVFTNYYTNKANINLSKDLAREAYLHDYNMWKEQNMYNLPKNQMKRLEAAGLNPRLMYGKGDTGNAKDMPRYQKPEPKIEAPKMDIAGRYMDMRRTDIQEDAVAAQIGINEARAVNEMAKNAGILSDNTKKAVEASFAGVLNSMRIRQSGQTIKNLTAQYDQIQEATKNLVADRKVKIGVAELNSLNQALVGEKISQEKFTTELMSKGVTWSDAIYYRAAVNMLKDYGNMEWLKEEEKRPVNMREYTKQKYRKKQELKNYNPPEGGW